MDLPYAQAIYTPSPVLEYQRNPLIEALPPILSKDEAAARMMYRPPYDEKERSEPVEVRSHYLGRLRDIVIPSWEFYEAERIVSRLIRRAYVSRNPLGDGEVWRPIYGAQNYEVDRAVWEQLTMSDMIATILGLSGRGKSTMVHAIMRTYPHQVIAHTEYDGESLTITQVAWLKVTCPDDASIRDLCLAFFQALDRALGNTKFYQQYSAPRRTMPELQHAMRQLAATFHLGILIIDEIQRLNLAKTGGAAKLLSFVQSLQIDLKVPLCIVGTYGALGLFKEDVAHARRSSDNGLIELARPMRRNEDWDNFVLRLWRYSWVRTPLSLHRERDGAYFDLLFDLTQGITDALIILFKCAQQRAMNDDSESLTPGLLKAVYQDSLVLLHPALNALRTGRARSRDLYEQLWPSAAQLARLRDVDGAGEENAENHLSGVWGVTSTPTVAPASACAPPAAPPAERLGRGIAMPSEYRDLREFAKCDGAHQLMKQAGIVPGDPFDFTELERGVT